MAEPEVKVETEVKPEPKPIKDKYSVGGRDYELSKEDIEHHLTTAAHVNAFAKNLIDKGVIDNEGNLIVKKEEPKKEEEEVEPIDEVKKEVSTLKSKVEKQELDRKTKDYLDKVEGALESSSQEHENTKSNSRTKAMVNAIVSAHLYANPQANIKEIYKQTAETINDLVKKEHEEYLKSKTRSSSSKTDGGGSGGSIFTLDKPPTKDDFMRGNLAQMAIDKLNAVTRSV
jgi:hypothetical protein